MCVLVRHDPTDLSIEFSISVLPLYLICQKPALPRRNCHFLGWDFVTGVTASLAVSLFILSIKYQYIYHKEFAFSHYK